jgi:hypothetical protein
MLRFGIAIFLMTISAANADPIRFVTEDFAPFNYQTGDKVSGPGAEIVRLICASLKWNAPSKFYLSGARLI